MASTSAIALPRVRPRERPRAVVAVCGLMALGVAVRFYGLAHQGLWFDEANTAALVRYSPGDMLGLIPQSESTPPLYYMVAWVWVRLFGNDAAGLRSLSAVAGVLVIPVAYAAAVELVSRRAGVICAALTACNPFLIWYSQEARSYQLLVLLTALALWAFARARRDPSVVNVAMWVLAAVLSMATHYFATLAIVPQAVALVAIRPRCRSVHVGVAVAAVCGIGLIPLVISQNGTGNDGWIATEPLRLRLAQILPQFLIGTNAPARHPLKLAALALAALALCLLAWRATRSHLTASVSSQLRGAMLAAALTAAGFALGLMLLLGGFDDLITRNIIELWLPAAIVVAAGCAAPSGVDARVGGAVAFGLCAIGLTAAVAVAVTPSMQRPDWPGVARLLGAEPDHGRPRAILVQQYQTLLPLKLYLPGLKELHGRTRVTELDVVSMRSPVQPDCWWGAECNLVSSPMQGSYPVHGVRTAWVRHVGQFTVRRLVARGPVTVTPAIISRALTTTVLSHDELMVQSPRR
jgi:mannosyltransferase